MASPNRPARLNRVLLFLVGLVLLAAAAFALLTAFGVLRVLARDRPLTPTQLSLPTWASYVAVAAAVVIGLLCLRWLLAQTLRQPKTGTWSLEADPSTGATRIDAQTAVDPFVDEVEGYPGVHRASARLSGTAARPVLHVVVGTDETADVSELRRLIDSEAVPRLCRALDLTSLPVDVLLRLDDAPAPRSARIA